MALLAVLGVGLWFAIGWGRREPAGNDDDDALLAPASPARAPVAPTPAERKVPPDAGAGRRATTQPVPPMVQAANVDPLPADARQPHPITPAHIRIQRENNLIGALNGAMDAQDAAGMRKLVDEYRDEFPEDANDLQKGYEVIADCLDHPGAASSTAGQRYYDQARGSILRRFVARNCLLPQDQ